MAIRKPAKPASKKPRRPARAKRAPKRARSIWERIEALGASIPPDELARHPPDGAANLEHYLYGSPKQDPG